MIKRILSAFICVLLLTTAAVAGTKYIEGSTTGLYYDPELDMWLTRIIHVYTMHSRSLVDDISYIVVGDGSMATKAFLLEKGLPGEPNKDTREERKRFVNQLEEGILLMEEAKRDGKDFTRHLARYYGMELKLKSEDKGRDVKIGVLLHDYEKKEDITVYLNEREVNELISLLEQVPPALRELREKEPKYPLLP